MSELTIILKCDDKVYKEKFLVYEDYRVSDSDDLLQGYINEAKAGMKGEPEEIIINIKMIVLEGQKKVKKKG